MIKDLLVGELVTIAPQATLQEAASLMESRNVGALVVISESDVGKPRGILTGRDIVVRCLAKNLDVSTTVENVLTESLETCPDTAGIYECISLMRKAGVRRIPVVDSAGNAIGLVSFNDLVAILSKELFTLTGDLDLSGGTANGDDGLNFSEKSEAA
jgi:signal-transduction protein with cAMP-binding, CBS, and nucleotidyltransferase domain